MSSGINFFLRTNLRPEVVETNFRAQLTANGADVTRHWVTFRAADDEDRVRGREDFGFEPTVAGVVQAHRGESDIALSRAALEVAHSAGAELVALHDGTPLFAYAKGVARFPPEDREFYETNVLPGFTGKVGWEKLSLG